MSQEIYIRSALEQMLEEFADGKPEVALLTTFNFNSSFFESNVLPLLVGMGVEGIGKGKAIARNVNEGLNKVKVIVACDRSSNPDAKGNYNYGLFNTGLPNGRFHPKIILLTGKLKDGTEGACISIASANLSFSGWASNREVVGWTSVYSSHVEEISPLLKWLSERAESVFSMSEEISGKEEGDIREILKDIDIRLNKINVGAPEGTPKIMVAIPGSEKSILSFMQSDKEWDKITIFSPYWSSIDKLLPMLKTKERKLVLTRNYNGRFDFPLGYDGLDQVEFAEFSNSERFSHAKVYKLESHDESRVCMGSANFSTAALRDESANNQLANIEAVLLYSSKPGIEYIKEPKLINISLDKIKENIAEKESNLEEGAPQLPPFEIDVLFDWKIKKAAYRFIAGKRLITDIKLKIGNKLVLLNCEQKDGQKGSIDFNTARLIRSFRVIYREVEKEYEYKGIVYQLNAGEYELGYFPKPSFDDMIAMMLSLTDGMNSDDVDKITRRFDKDHGGDGEEEKPEEETVPVVFDFFKLYQGFYKLLKHKNKNPKADYINQSTGLSLKRLFDSLVEKPKDTNDKLIAEYLILLQINEVLKKFREKCDWQSDLKGSLEEARELVLNIMECHGMNPIGTANDKKFINWCEQQLEEAWINL